MSFIQVHGIRKEYPGIVALNNVDLSVELGTIHVLAGENGAGKSTLVKILTGVESPTKGEIFIDSRDPLDHHHSKLFANLAYVPQEINLFLNMTVAENLFMPFERSEIGGKMLNRSMLATAAQKYIDRFRIHAEPHQLVKDIMVSDQQLLQIARASTNRNFKVLILDEPTTSFTVSETEKLFEIIAELKSTNHAIIFISHKLEEMFALGDEVTVLRNGENVGYSKMDAIDERGLIKLMSGKEINLEEEYRPAIMERRTPLLEAKNLTGSRFEHASFTLYEGEILGFAGLVGAGRSELMQTMFGYLKAKSGAMTVGGMPWKLGDTNFSVRQGMFYLSEERKQHGILPLLSLRENIGIALFQDTVIRHIISDSKEKALVQDVVDTYDIKTDSLKKKIIYLSGGNQQKSIIGRAMACRPKVLIFDEPTKGIDVKTKVDIYMIMKKLAEKGVGIILISSEMDELQKCASRIMTMYHGRINGEFVTAHTDNRTLVTAIIGAQGGEQ